MYLNKFYYPIMNIKNKQIKKLRGNSARRQGIIYNILAWKKFNPSTFDKEFLIIMVT